MSYTDSVCHDKWTTLFYLFFYVKRLKVTKVIDIPIVGSEGYLVSNVIFTH